MLVALLITDVAFGVVSRVVPQLNVFAVGFPAKVAVALLVVGGLAAVHGQLDLRTALGERGRGARRAARGMTDDSPPRPNRDREGETHRQAPQARDARRGRSRAAATWAARWC